MITNFLLDHPRLMLAALTVTAVVCVVAGYALLRARRHGILWTLAAVSLLPVAALTLVPTAGRSFTICAIQFAVPTFDTVEPLANVALFIPPVFFATLATHRPLLTLAAGTALSALIEATQSLLPAIGRACDTNDWAMNTTGTVIAVLLATATTALTPGNAPPTHRTPKRIDG